MGGSWYPTLLIYGISVTWDEVITNFHSEVKLIPDYSDHLCFFEKIEFYEIIIKEKYDLTLYHYLESSFSRWEGCYKDEEDYCFAIGKDININKKSYNARKLQKIEDKLNPLFKKVLEDFPLSSVKYMVGVKA